MRWPGFFAGSSPSQSKLATCQRSMNLYLEKVTTEGTQSQELYLPTPGQQVWATSLDVGTRAALSVNGQTFFVIGAWLYEATAPNVVTRRGIMMAQDNNPAQIVFNGPVGGQLLVCSGGNAYCYVIATLTMTQVLTGEATQIGMLDGFFLAFASNKVRISDLNDGTVWDPLQFIVRSAQPDPWKAMIVNSPDIFLIGELTGDVLYDSGASPFPIAPRQGLALPFGIASAFSLGNLAGSMFWLTNNKEGAGLVVQTRGYQPQPIASPELATAISTYARTGAITNAESLVYQQEGHTFYVLRFPGLATWAYDLTTGLWAERGKWIAAENRFDVWTPRVHVYAFGKHLVGDQSTGQISELDVTFGLEADGTAIRRLLVPATLINEMRRLSVDVLELIVENGLGLAVGQGSDPTIMLEVSEDGGKTWGSERWAGVGKAGDYRHRTYWTRFGAPRLLTPRFTFTDPIPLRICDCVINNRGQSQGQAA